MGLTGSRLLRWGPMAVLSVVFVALAVWSPETLRVSATNPLAWIFLAAVAALSIGLNLLIGGKLGRPVLGRLVGLVPVVVALVWGFLPAFRDVQVDDAAPPGLPEVVAQTTSAQTTSAETTSAEPTGTSATAGAPSTGTAGATTAPPTTPPPTTAAPTTTPPQAGPVDLGSADLQSLDYQATGTARLVQVTAAELLVRFESLDVENGPDYVVYLVAGIDRQAPGNGIFLGELRGNQGDQNYDVPAGTVAEGPQTILIWCRSFAAPVANATVG